MLVIPGIIGAAGKHGGKSINFAFVILRNTGLDIRDPA
jgi:hypothetical protein